MGTSISLCEAIQTPDVFVQLDTAQKQLQRQEFLFNFPKIKLIVAQKLSSKINNFHKVSPRKFLQGIYIGQTNQNTLPHTSQKSEHGIFMYQIGFLYLGQFKKGKRQGEGILINEDGDYYQGLWQINNPCGYGEYFSTQSSRSYKGKWINGTQNGLGKQTYEDGSMYMGEFINGFKHGKGRLEYPDGTFYDGEFVQNSINGQGVCEGKFHKYEGEWENGKMHGNGISTWTDDKGAVISSYVGQYKEGLKHGYGQYRWAQKKIYKGKWQEGDMSSEGVLLNYEA